MLQFKLKKYKKSYEYFFKLNNQMISSCFHYTQNQHIRPFIQRFYVHLIEQKHLTNLKPKKT